VARLALTLALLAPPPSSTPAEWPWQALRRCEAPAWAGGWQAHTGNGYYGGLQFRLGTWLAYRPAGFPYWPHLATPAQQVAVARRVLAVQGWAAWPVCSRRIGAR
jgi:hypothetical protein